MHLLLGRAGVTRREDVKQQPRLGNSWARDAISVRKQHQKL